MGIILKVRDWIMNIFKTEAEKKFNAEIISNAKMEAAQAEWEHIINATPYWLNHKDDIETINFAKFICQYTAKKVCLELNVTINGSERADYINECIKQMVKKSVRDKVEDACGFGGIILKPNGTYNPAAAIDYILPGNYAVTDKNSNGDILGCIFIDRIQKGDTHYTRLEYHHFANVEDEQLYIIENKAFKSSNEKALGKEIQLTELSEWKDIQPYLMITNVEKPLFAYLKMPFNNTIDYNSPEGVAIFSNCIKELKHLDIAWSRKAYEVEDSKHLTFMNENVVEKNPRDPKKKKVTLPRFIKGMRMGIEDKNTIQEHVATLLTESRIADINSILSMISTKCGFSQGQFILDRKTGRITATQIESDDSETVETITDVRTSLKQAVFDLVYALDKYCDVFFDMPSGYVNALDSDVADEDIFYFRDLMSTFEQDRARAYQLLQNGIYSKKKYLVEYEGFSDEEAKKMLAEAKKENQEKERTGLFGEE